tara:strand:- start:88 stop:870 length:783 start_codon:yes stop_codon:yes gene_type:complete
MSVVINGSTGGISKSGGGNLVFESNVTTSSGVTIDATKLTGAVPTASLNSVDGSGLTNIDAANIASGSIADARLPSNIQSFPAPGTSGNTLQSDGTNWTSAAAGAGGAWEVVQNGTVGGATLILGSLTKTTRVIINKYHNSGNMVVEYSTTGGNSYLTSGLEVSADDAYTTTEWTNGAAGFNSSPWGSLYTGIMDYTIFRPEDATAPIMARFETSGTFSARGGYDTIQGHVRYNTAAAVNRLKFTQLGTNDKFLVLRMTY